MDATLNLKLVSWKYCGNQGDHLEVGKGVQGEDDGWDDDEADGDERHNLMSKGRSSENSYINSRSLVSPVLQERCEVFRISPTSTSVFGQECPAGRTLAPRPGSGRCHRPWAKASPFPPCQGTWARAPGSSAAGSKAPGRARRCPSSRGPAWRRPRSPPEGWIVMRSVVIFFCSVCPRLKVVIWKRSSVTILDLWAVA